MNNKKILIYPYDADYEVFLRYNNLQNHFDFSFLIYGYDIRNQYENNNTCFVRELSKDIIRNTDYIYITESAEKLSVDIVLSVLGNFVGAGKKFWFLMNILANQI